VAATKPEIREEAGPNRTIRGHTELVVAFSDRVVG
jgi:hypothetical protein